MERIDFIIKRVFNLYFLILISFIMSGFSLSNLNNEEIEIITPNVSKEESIHNDMVLLDYASDDIVIFHSYFGLFVYDIKSKKIIRSLDLENLNLHQIQGDNSCEITVNNDASIIQLSTVPKESMYIYNIEDNILLKSKYKDMKNKSDTKIKPYEIQGDNQFMVLYGVEFDNGDFGYLKTEDSTIESLEYIRGDNHYKIFE